MHMVYITFIIATESAGFHSRNKLFIFRFKIDTIRYAVNIVHHSGKKYKKNAEAKKIRKKKI